MGQGRGMPGTTKDHQADRLQAIRLRYSINTYGAAIGLQGGEVVRLLTRRQWREGGTAALKVITDRLGLDVPPGGSA